MPQSVNKKAQEKQAKKIVEDKTFGLKNKKGRKQQEFIKQVSQSTKSNQAKRQNNEPDKRTIKSEKEKELKELQQLFKPCQSKQKIDPSVDPKSVLCLYFKQGLCDKGDRCKFSHDLAVERSTEKKNLYVDNRDLTDKEKNETMDDWDTQKLEDVVSQKHGETNKNRTDIICKYFIDAVEKRLYGWFWVCPNGGDSCIYRHCLPPGYVLKKNEKAKKIEDETSLEEHIEQQRWSLGELLTPVTEESFNDWKKKKISDKKVEIEREILKKKNDYLHGKSRQFSGRELFSFNPNLITEDDEDATNDPNFYAREDHVNGIDIVPVIDLGKLSNLVADASLKRISDEKATKVSSLRPQDRDVSSKISFLQNQCTDVDSRNLTNFEEIEINEELFDKALDIDDNFEETELNNEIEQGNSDQDEND